MDAAKLNELKKFIQLCKSNSSILDDPSLSFFRDYLHSLGAKIPSSADTAADSKSSYAVEESDEELADAGVKINIEEEEEEDEIIESDIELEGDTVEPDNEPPQKMGDPSVEVTDDNRDASHSAKAKAMDAISEGKFEEAIENLTQAILLNPTSAIMYGSTINSEQLKKASNILKNKESNMSKEVSEEGVSRKDYVDPPPAPLIDVAEIKLWSFYRALIAEFIATLLFLYVTIATVIGHKKQHDACDGVGLLGIAWAFGGMIFILVYCTAGISGGHINPAVTFGLFLARKVSLIRAVAYMVAQCLGAICGVGLVKAFMKSEYNSLGGGANTVATGYNQGTALGAEIIGTFVLVYTVFSATDPKRSARDSHVPVLAPLPIGFAVFMVHLATIPITGTGINPARSFGAAVIYDNDKAWDDHWIFWVGPMVGALAAAAYHQYILRAAAIKALGSFRSNPSN